MLLPPACAGCGRYGTVVCGECLATFMPPSAEDERFLVPDAGAVVGEALTLAVAAFAYEGTLRRILGRVKYASAARVTAVLAAAARPAFLTLRGVTGPATLVPVPLHARRRRERGFNQAALIAAALAQGADVEARDVLVRARETARQHGLDRAGRAHNLSGAFRVAPGVAAPAVAIVVDDILTTSATMEACASALLESGAEQVYGFALAREV